MSFVHYKFNIFKVSGNPATSKNGKKPRNENAIFFLLMTSPVQCQMNVQSGPLYLALHVRLHCQCSLLKYQSTGRAPSVTSILSAPIPMSTTPSEIWDNILKGNVEKDDPLWNEYLDKAAVFDKLMVDEWNKIVDVLLVYVCYFLLSSR